MSFNGTEKPQADKLNSPYDRIVGNIRNLYDGDISDQEAHEAARNLIGFCKLLLEIRRQRLQNHMKEQ
jgi:hypothetical protein